MDKMRSIVILIALCVIGKSVQKIPVRELNVTASSDRILCINVALETYLKDYRNIRVFLTNSSDLLVNSIFNGFPLFVITEWRMLRKGLFPAATSGAMIIFLEGNYKQDFNGLKILKETVEALPVLLVCVTDVICSSNKYVKKISQISVDKDLRYLAIDEGGVIDIYEHTTTINGNCGTGQLLKRGRCSDRLTTIKAFRKSVNYNRCPMHVVTWFSPPYSENCSDHQRSDQQLCGIAGHVVRFLSEKMNATVVVEQLKTPEDVRAILASKKADLGYGALDDRAHNGVTYSVPYMFMQATIVAPHSMWALHHSSGNILQPFENEVWLGIGLVIALILVLGCAVPYLQPIYLDQLCGIFLGIPVSRQPRILPNRIYFLSLVLFSYFCSQAYLTNLTKVLATPRQEMIRSLNDIENSAIRVAGPTAGRARFAGDYPRIYKDFLVDDQSVYYKNLYRLLQGRFKAAYYVEDLDRNIASWKNVEAINERFNWYSVVLATPNTSTFLRSSNIILLKIWESGILGVHYTYPAVRYPAPDSKEITSSEKTVVLQFDDLKGVFLLLITGLTLSSLIFISEVVVVFLKQKPEIREKDEGHLEWRKRYETIRLRQTYRSRRH